ncbi:cytochrome P450 [Amycolatopsis sp. CA-128772]|uniref:cytochrome P450 n=1 Tax=Amycolatopsis sp. CA-128772 TaxID=2073159 RepID=UPI000CD2F195|nr:cytochrome P450 [Amycolatopsis sp. CA-128772]
MATTVDGGTPVPFLDVTAPGFGFGTPEVAEAQARSWYAESPVGLFVLRYAEGHALLRDQRLNHNGKRFMEMNGVTGGPIHDWFVPMIMNHDGAHHRRLRGLVGKAFTPKMIAGLRPFIRARAEKLAGDLAEAGACEFIGDFANPLPLAVMSEMLGVPPEDHELFHTWTTDVGLVFSIALGGDVVARVEAALVGLGEYIDALVSRKKALPGDDLISALVAARQDDSSVSAAELRNLIVTTVFAAHDTTRHQLANAMVAFAGHPDQWRLLGDRPDLADQAVDEVMRWLPSSPTIYRFAAEDFEYQGLPIAKDTFLTVCVTAAQRDPRVFRNGAKFDITVPCEAPLLQFGAGPHHCLGIALAKAELAEALPALATRLGVPAVAGPFTWRPPIGIHGPNALPLRFA